MSTPDFSKIQKLVLKGCNADYSYFMVLTIENASLARTFLRKLGSEGWIPNAKKSEGENQTQPNKNRCPISVGLTYQGLLKLSLKPRYQEIFKNKARAFSEGAYFRASTHLSDTENNAPRFWSHKFRKEVAHVFLTLHGDDKAALENRVAELQTFEKTLSHEQNTENNCRAFTQESWSNNFNGAHLDHENENGNDKAEGKFRRVHFGMLDGISQPCIEAYSGRRNEENHKIGEFILGYDNDSGYNSWRLSNVRPDLKDTSGAKQSEKIASFFKNASFGIFRPMAQDEDAFKAFVEKNAGKLSVSEEFVRAKLIGRWDNGHVVKPEHKESPKTDSSALNQFDFLDDPDGKGCPFGSHIRRMNPRSDPVVPFRKRPLMRRGIPYGPKFNGTNGAVERGLLGLFFCASIEDQFEHLLREWANDNPMGVPNQGDAKDPLIGNHAQTGTRFDVPMRDGSHETLEGFAPFIQTKGTLYAFFPGLNGLDQLEDEEVFEI